MLIQILTMIVVLMVNDMLVDNTNKIVCRSCKSCSRSWLEKSWWCLRSPSPRRGRGTSSGSNATTSNNLVLIISKMILPRKWSCLENDHASKMILPRKWSCLMKTLPALSLPLPIECWVYNATRSLSFVILKRRQMSIQMKISNVVTAGPLECWIGAHKEHRLYSPPSCCSRQAL